MKKNYVVTGRNHSQAPAASVLASITVLAVSVEEAIETFRKVLEAGEAFTITSVVEVD